MIKKGSKISRKCSRALKSTRNFGSFKAKYKEMRDDARLLHSPIFFDSLSILKSKEIYVALHWLCFCVLLVLCAHFVCIVVTLNLSLRKWETIAPSKQQSGIRHDRPIRKANTVRVVMWHWWQLLLWPVYLTYRDNSLELCFLLKVCKWWTFWMYELTVWLVQLI